MPEALLATKLHIPRPRRNLVQRSRLVELLAAGSRRKLTLVSAPAGYGKTTLVADWIGISQVATGWVSLDEADNDPARFLTYVIAALQQIDGSIGHDVEAALAGSQAPPGAALLTRLVNDIEAAGARGSRAFVLVLDDYHLITAQPVHDILNFLLEHLPAAMHLLVAGRSDPPLPISRLRVQGEITEVRTPELRFTREEETAFLNDLMGLELSPGAVAALDARTEGWIASLQLAALSLRGRPDKHEFLTAFSGSHRYVIDYLMDEVLSRQPAAVQAFLLRTSILSSFSAPLCDAVCVSAANTHGISASRQILRQLEDDNLFLIPLDEERRWYRYHHLFADFLAQRLRRRESAKVPELHRRASQWYEAAGLMDEAIQHALLAKDMERATRLVDHIAASLIVRREANRLLRLVDQLPPSLCHDYPMLCLWHAWGLVFAGELDKVESVLQRTETSPDPARQSPPPGYATTVRAYLANQRGNLEEAIDLTQHALEQLNDAPDDRTTLIFRGAAVLWLGVNYRLRGELDQASQLYAEAATLNRKAGNYYGALASKEQAADVAKIQGQLHRSAELYRRALRLADSWYRQEGMARRSLPAATGPHLGLGTVLYQWNDLEAAAPHLQRAVELGELEQAWWRIHAYRMQAFLKSAQGDLMAAYDYLSQACAIREDLTFHQVNISAQPSLEQMRILLSRVNPEMGHLLPDAVRQIEGLGLDLDARLAHTLDFTEPAYYAREANYADLARVMVASGRAAEALPLIEQLVEAAQSMGRQGDAIRYLVLLALAFQAAEDARSALASLSQALALAEPEGYVRVFVDEGEPMAALLAQAASQGIAPDYAGELLAAFPEQVQQAVELEVAAPAAAQPLIDPLSDRELEVLRLMAAGLRHKEVAEELVISLNTVRHHARNIYSKLSVHSRVQAVTRAKALKLL